ncbi:hypothetical protein [Chromobacterium subtsugae]|uniref:hypothetical protein n=1 Tax=Chromobacterium subtsugae TaxID=251747 RepID=UPI0006417F82|nr:hypothetical protein [Chromobacterium subtsugae]
MTAATADRNTPMRDGEVITVPVAAGQIIRSGLIVCANPNGFALEGKTEADLVYLGRAERYVDNSQGTDGARLVEIRRGKMFKWANASDDPITQACIGQRCYVEDNQTVAKTNGYIAANGATPATPATRSLCGTVYGIDSDGVWVL